MRSLYRTILPSIFLILVTMGLVSATNADMVSDLCRKARIIPLQPPKQAHEFILPDINGNHHRLKDLQGKIVFLNIWATWCAPCRKEMPSIEALHRHFKGRGLAVLTVSVDVAEAEIVRAFVEKHNYTFTVLHDPKGKTMEWFRVRLIPVTYVINKSGRIIGKAVGIRDWGHEDVIELCEELLKHCDKK